MIKFHKNLKLISMIAILLIGGVLFGFNTGNISCALPLIIKDLHTTTIQNELLVFSTIFFAFVSSSISGYSLKNADYKNVIILSALIFIIGSFLSSISLGFKNLLVSRCIIGIGLGISSYVVPLYISELSPNKIRGKLVSANSIAITAGIAFAFLMGFIFASRSDWNGILSSGIYPALALLLCAVFLPNTPKYMIYKGYEKKALDFLKNFKKYTENEALLEIEVIKQSIKDFSKLRFFSLLKSKNIKLPLIIGLGLAFFQQFSGINALLYYGPFIFKVDGISINSLQFLFTLIIGIVNFIMSIIVMFCVDKFGRRPMLLVGTFLSGISLSSISVFLNFIQNTLQSTIVILSLFIFFVVGYAISLGTIFWVISSEIFPIRYRTSMMGVVNGLQWLSNSIVSITFLTVLGNIGKTKTFMIFSTVCFLAFIFTYKFIPETKNLNMKEIEDIFS